LSHLMNVNLIRITLKIYYVILRKILAETVSLTKELLKFFKGTARED